MRLDDDVKAVLRGVQCDHLQARITERLDRRMYERVNKALEALGGKWNRKAAAHIFPTDAAGTILAALTAGEVTTVQEEGFFPTPTDLARNLVNQVGLTGGDVVLEPSAGDGALVASIVSDPHEAPVRVYCVERNPGRRATLRERFADTPAVHVFDDDDFMMMPPLAGVDRVVMNPAFCDVAGTGDHLDHVRRAWTMLRPGGKLVSVLPAGVLFREDRRHEAFREWVDVVDGSFTELPEGAFRESGTMVRTCVVELYGVRARNR